LSIKKPILQRFENTSAGLILFIAICAVSTASLFIRYAQRDVSSVTIAWSRMLISTIVLTPFLGRKAARDLQSLATRHKALILLSGVFLGLHFIFWITSLESITVTSSVILVTTTPLWVAILSPYLLHEKQQKTFLFALGLAFIGIVIITIFGQGEGISTKSFYSLQFPISGYFLAICGAWCASGYSIIGRKMRNAISAESYIFIVYASASVVLSFVKVAFDCSGWISEPALIWLFLIALIPQVLGHSLFNIALRKVPAAIASLALLGEPVGSTILAYIFLLEIPSKGELLGGLLVVIGIILGSTQKSNTYEDKLKNLQ